MPPASDAIVSVALALTGVGNTRCTSSYSLFYISLSLSIRCRCQILLSLSVRCWCHTVVSFRIS